jgi:hypothetical protein
MSFARAYRMGSFDTSFWSGIGIWALHGGLIAGPGPDSNYYQNVPGAEVRGKKEVARSHLAYTVPVIEPGKEIKYFNPMSYIKNSPIIHNPL